MNLPADATETDRRLLATARDRVLSRCRERRAADRDDELFALVRADGETGSGDSYLGVPFEPPDAPNAGFCAERHALNRLRLAEPPGTRPTHVVVAGPVPDDDRQPTFPCGTCRDAIAAVGGPDVTVLATCFVRQPDGWELFPTVERRRVGDLVPDRWTDPWE